MAAVSAFLLIFDNRKLHNFGEESLLVWGTIPQCGNVFYNLARVLALYKSYRPVALRGHVTNASSKRCIGILLMPKIDRAHENYLTPKI